jgi:hypothetical protein
VDGVTMRPFQGFTWGKGPAEELARGIKSAQATQHG